jgi:hypothetical protein
VQQSEAIRQFQAGFNSMVEQGAEPGDLAATPLGIAHQLMVQNYGPEQSIKWVTHMAETIRDAHAGQPEKPDTH